MIGPFQADGASSSAACIDKEGNESYVILVDNQLRSFQNPAKRVASLSIGQALKMSNIQLMKKHWDAALGHEEQLPQQRA